MHRENFDLENFDLSRFEKQFQDRNLLLEDELLGGDQLLTPACQQQQQPYNWFRNFFNQNDNAFFNQNDNLFNFNIDQWQAQNETKAGCRNLCDAYRALRNGDTDLAKRELRDAAKDIRSAIKETREYLKSLSPFDPEYQDARKALKEMQQALKDTRQALRHLRNGGPFASWDAMNSIADASGNLRQGRRLLDVDQNYQWGQPL